MNYYLECWKKYATFSGRARRKEYWMFVLFNMLACFVAGIVDGILGSGSAVTGLYSLAVAIPSLAVLVRRLHDTGRSGWFVLLSFIPVVGGIILLVFACQDSAPGLNPYGPSPKV